MHVENNGRPRDKREAILQATLELIAERGFQDTPMSLISKRSQASAGIIYHYFPSKDDLLQSLYLRIKGDMGRAWIAADDQEQPLTKRFQSLWLVIFRYCIAHPQEMAFVEQYESLPLTQQQTGGLSERTRTIDDLRRDLHSQGTTKDLPLDVKVLYRLMTDLHDQGLIKDLPLEVISAFTFGVVLKLAKQCSAGLLSVDEATLLETAKASWDAIAQ